jgi:hypothetical protein
VDDVRKGLRRIHETHRLYMPLQYPLVFPKGDYGYEEDIPYREFEDEEKNQEVQGKELPLESTLHFACKIGIVSLEIFFLEEDCFSSFPLIVTP